MFTADTKNRQRSGASVSQSYQYQNRAAAAGRHSNVELVNAQHQGSGRPRQLRAPLGLAGGGSADFWDHTKAYPAAGVSVVQITTTQTYNSVTILPGTYALRQGQTTAVNPTGNDVPQFPYPGSGTIKWLFIGPMPTVVNVCTSGGNQSVYVGATAPF